MPLIPMPYKDDKGKQKMAYYRGKKPQLCKEGCERERQHGSSRCAKCAQPVKN